MLFKVLSNLTHFQKACVLLSVDLTAITLALCVAFSNTAESTQWMTVAWYLPAVLVAGTFALHSFGLNRVKLNTFGIDEVAKVFIVAAALSVTGYVVSEAIGPSHLRLSTMVEFGAFFAFLSVGSRFLMLRIVERIYATQMPRKQVLIYGAGQTGQQMAAALQTDHEFKAFGFVDDDPNLQKLTILGLKVHSPKRIASIVRRNRIDRVVLAMPSANQSVRLRIGKRLSGLECEVLAMPSFADIVLRGEEVTAAAPIKLDSLLGRDAVESELPQTEGTYRDHRILVTGAGGSIGGELCRQIARCRPQNLVLVDHSEYALYRITNELRQEYPGLRMTAVLGSIEHPELMRETLMNHQIEVVFHAAAYKHVNMVETNAFEGVRNNVIGTRVLAEEARLARVDRFILVSTDKAVRPQSTMGSTKRMAELVIQDLAKRSEHTKFSMVRFGNVLGSSGSVIPLFQKQIRDLGPVTVTHPEVTRYFMTIDEAVRLVLLTGTFSRGGDVFVLDMGAPVSIYEMARKMIEAAGYSVRDEANPSGDIPIAFTGLQDGEKMHEELLIGSDMLTTPHPKIMRAQEKMLSELQIASALQDLRRAIETRDEGLLTSTLRCYVETEETEVVAAPLPKIPALSVVGEF
ncbi:polysaccharide biosynthesis protein [Shimia sagamensis]|uniref:NDP-sugar epimerase, includes UDP-GlcNAc-inverting 4,6-dehydratase FlaA1 and capsular polysaccharide biosynthesis protein EpsC n=1 Tax=Shimia sagamensis TaxID=1566352 RepID=A0ABY1NAI3_9RHOB|nr:nucleoside-diphosphate sugar epimerase/dehydratase [Shimia sagamensis]SMP04903.1 NDP-sugar epimerase, includes UDP-GlcNAc-inverting 4,6-dehydratase FlaA1 and capsular polysaccharide biosynthesis protein EpsC [Shimia sagamensis]